MSRIGIFALLALLLFPWELEAAFRKMMGRPALKNPIVLVHGSTEKGSQLKIGPFDFGEYFRRVPEYYSGTGTPVYVVHLTTDGSIGERAAVLKNFLQTDLKGRMVNIIGHSLGGLDARYATSVLGAGQIASITTVGTPHKGSPVADWAVRQMNRGGLWYWLFRLVGYDMKQRRFLPELTTHFMQDVFNPKVPDLPDVKYFSVTSHASFNTGTMSYLLWLPKRWLEAEKHPLAANGHDGLVPLDSQIWGQEIFRANLDHLGQMNHHEFRNVSHEGTSLNLYAKIYDNLLAHGL